MTPGIVHGKIGGLNPVWDDEPDEQREHRSCCCCQPKTAGAAVNRRNVQTEGERDKYHVLLHQHKKAGPAQRPACPPRKNGCEGGQQYGRGEGIRVKVEQIRKLERWV